MYMDLSELMNYLITIICELKLQIIVRPCGGSKESNDKVECMSNINELTWATGNTSTKSEGRISMGKSRYIITGQLAHKS